MYSATAMTVAVGPTPVPAGRVGHAVAVTYVLVRIEGDGRCSLEGGFHTRERAQQDVRAEEGTTWHLLDVGDAAFMVVHQHDDGALDLVGTFATDIEADASAGSGGGDSGGRRLRFRVPRPVEDDIASS